MLEEPAKQGSADVEKFMLNFQYASTTHINVISGILYYTVLAPLGVPTWSVGLAPWSVRWTPWSVGGTPWSPGDHQQAHMPHIPRIKEKYQYS